MNNIFSKLALVGLFAIAANKSYAQLSLPNAFIKADHVEVGVSVTGAYGACSALSGYHNNVGTNLGFVSDPDKDGWLVSAPGSANYMGDYFVPGSPYEGWDMEVNGTVYRYRNCPSAGTCPGSYCANVSYTATATDQTTIWNGTLGNLSIVQKTVVRKTKLYFVAYIDITNTGATIANGVYYFRGLDPDNDQPWTLGGFPTDNRVVFQPNSLSKKCLVTANGRGYPAQAYLGLGTKDCRAKCCIFSPWPFTGKPSDVYNQTGTASTGAGFSYNVGSTTLNLDIAIGMTFSLGNLNPGQKTSLAFAYILKQADLDSALGETEPKFESGGTPYAPYSTLRVCPGKTVPLKVVNGGQYTWIWTPGTNMAPSGTSTAIAVGGTTPITGSIVYPTGGVLGDSAIITVLGSKTYTAMGISNCDTQYLTFYVDTINFSIPPSSTTPISYCEGATTVALTAGVTAGATLNWYTSGIGGVASPTAPKPSSTFPVGKTTPFDTTSYWVSQTNSAGCETPRLRIDVIVTKKPTPPVTANLVYCVGDTTKLLTAVGSNLSWFDAATAGKKYTSTPIPANFPAGITSYFVSQTVNGCESDRAQLDVEISQMKDTFTISKDSLCGSELLVLTNNSKSSSAGSYTNLWTFGDGASATDSNTTHSYEDVRGTYTIKLASVNVHGCKDSFTKKVEVFKEPLISMTASDTIICQGESVDFKGTATSGYSSLTWDFGDGDPAYNTLEVRHSFTKSGLFNILLKGTYPACPGVGSGININAIAIPNVNLGRDTSLCIGNVALTLKNLNPATVDKYIWNTKDTTATIKVRQAGQYSLTVENWKCSATDSITVSKACYLDIPNAFTPDAGGDYDSYFLPRNLLSKSAVTFNMKIFDRWGQLIFESDKVDGRGWDGTYKGQSMPVGVYVYMIRVSFANGVSESYDGNVTLLR
ncbi:MAG: PKD domain-containing protein [Phycisphaerales bacterium]|nr:PKD domain-containing protein [Phycisphaerales bacterium]